VKGVPGKWNYFAHGQEANKLDDPFVPEPEITEEAASVCAQVQECSEIDALPGRDYAEVDAKFEKPEEPTSRSAVEGRPFTIRLPRIFNREPRVLGEEQ
jgi:hypothetical protein